MIKALKRLFRRRNKSHLCAHAHVAEVYRCRCGDSYIKERR